MQTRRISSIKIGVRHRKDLGDLEKLAESLDAIGLLHPVVIDTKNRLIAGQRRLTPRVPSRATRQKRITQTTRHPSTSWVDSRFGLRSRRLFCPSRP